jgi:hypothetical protein
MSGLRCFAVAGARIGARMNDICLNEYFSWLGVDEAGGAKHVSSQWVMLHGKNISIVCKARAAMQCIVCYEQMSTHMH